MTGSPSTAASQTSLLPQTPLGYKILVDSIADYAIYMLDVQGTVLNWNKGARRAKGYLPEEIVGRHFSCFYTEEDRRAGLPALGLETARLEGRFENEGWRVRKDGTRFWAHVVIEPVSDDTGTFLGFAKITQDRTEWHRLQQQTYAQERKFRLLVEGVTDYAIYMLDREGFVSNWNAGAERAKGYTASEIVGQHFSRFYSVEDQAAGLPAQSLSTALRSGRYDAEGWRLRKDGARFWAHVVIQPIYDEHGTLFGFTKITRDCTQQRMATLALMETSRNLDLALANMQQGLCLFDADARLTLNNRRFFQILSIGEEAFATGQSVGNFLRRILHEVRPLTKAQLHRLRRHLSLSAQHHEGVQTTEIDYLDRILCLHTRRLEAGEVLLTLEDITERRLSEHRIEYLARHDSLTGLPNRFDFQDRLKRLLAVPADRSRFALLYLDLDSFKAVNDSLGHHSGDMLLKLVAARLQDLLREGEQVSRLGGDEFTILIPVCNRVDEATAVAQRCIRELTRAFEVASHDVRIGVSIGIFVSTATPASFDVVMQQADQAMYKAKRDGRNCYRIFDAAMNDPLRWQDDMEAGLRRALVNGQLQVNYQPILDAVTGATTAMEALLRWTHPTRGDISPSEFIPLAEERQLMPDIGAWALRRACTDAMTWPVHVRLTINVSPLQLTSDRFPGLLDGILKETGLSPGRLELEITETTMMGSSEKPRDVLKQARAMGVAVAMDDFGLGYSSLNLLQNFPFTRVKIDRSFVHGIGINAKSIVSIRSIIALCRSLGLPVTAEGVETEHQRQVLCEEDCSELQGFLFDAALPIAQVAQAILNSRPWEVAAPPP